MSLLYREYCYLIPFLLLFTSSWIFFIKSNFFNVKVKTVSTDCLSPSNVVKKTHYSVFLKWISIQYVLFFFNFFFIKGYSTTFLWNQFYINNFNIYLTQIALILIFIIVILTNSLTQNNINYNIDFFFAINNVIFFLILILYTNNIFSFVFLLELNSIVLFYKFVCSKYWYNSKKELDENKFDLNNRIIPKNYLNMLFFQYWSTFFSSILIFFSLANVFYIYGSTDYVLIEALNLINSNNFTINNKFVACIWLPFLIGFLIKIGLTPFHLFKIEVYKGLPVVSLLFYTTFYFFIYFLYLIIFINYHLDFLKVVLNSIFYIAVIAGIVYVIFLIFDVTSLKSFFAYSTIINSLLFFIASYLF